ncbi:hypothetical protein LTR49_001062 [Elasticomyces elasticus]|nr:hypothetical protein LTR49_001062 [Elasticomyces elasticus]KAK5769660.1 hypothetical protein LTS12_000110 [Elasticomyces elasticus]
MPRPMAGTYTRRTNVELGNGPCGYDTNFLNPSDECNVTSRSLDFEMCGHDATMDILGDIAVGCDFFDLFIDNVHINSVFGPSREDLSACSGVCGDGPSAVQYTGNTIWSGISGC